MSEVGVGGYAGKLLRVDLSFERLSDVVLEEETLRKYIGGTGVGAKILYDEVPPQTSWADPVNRITIASGPLGGTAFPGSGTISLVTKGALTNGATAVQANGRFGAYLRFNRYDGIVLQGAARRWLYLAIEEGHAELRDASHLLGLGTYETGDALRAAAGETDRAMSVLSIGPAGEHRARFAGVFVDKGHSASHNGPGAVMGSKRLKAIAVPRGTRQVPVRDRARLAAVADKVRGGRGEWRGTVGGVHTSQLSGRGTLPIKNYTTSLWAISEEKLNTYSEPYIRGHFSPRPSPCWACTYQHSTIMTIPEGPYAGMEVEEPEYEQLAAWGPVIDNWDVFAAAMLSGVCDRLGLENNEAGWLVGWVMECYEKGYLTKEATDGLEMRWGNVEAVRQLLYMVAHRQGFGDLLAEGVMRASQQLGGAAADCAIYTLKGNIPRGHDHRSRWGELFDTVVTNTGTLENSTQVMTPAAAGPGNWKATSTEEATHKGKMALDDSLGTCRFNSAMDMEVSAEAIAAITGWAFTPEEAFTVGRRTVNLMKAFNIRCGIGRAQDYPSTRYGSTPVDGPSKGLSVMEHWEEMLDNYYRLMEWDVTTGKPLPETLRKLGLEHVVKDLW